MAFSLLALVSLSPLGACDDDHTHTADAGDHDEDAHTHDGGHDGHDGHEHDAGHDDHGHADAGHDDHGDHTDDGHDDHGDHTDDGHDDHGDHGGGSCPHMGAVVECDEDALTPTVGATMTTDDGVTAEVTGVMPGDLMAGGDHEFMLMVKLVDADGAPVDGAEIDRVYTMAHGGHASCGAPELMAMGEGMYHFHGLTYPHGGTWFHTLTVGEGDLALPLCVATPEDW